MAPLATVTFSPNMVSSKEPFSREGLGVPDHARRFTWMALPATAVVLGLC